MIIYAYFDGYNYTEENSLYTRLSFGDMGYSGFYCGQNFIDWSKTTTKLNLQCQGTARIREVISTGIVDMTPFMDDENSIVEYNRCYYERPIDYDINPQMRNFDDVGVSESILQQCNGLQKCQPVIDEILFGVTDKNYNQFFFA